MATIAPRRMRTKLRLYLSHEAGKPRRSVILVVTTTTTRQAAIAEWVRDEAAWLRETKGVPADATRFFLTTADRITPSTVLSEPIWQVVGGPDRFSLVPPTSKESIKIDYEIPVVMAAASSAGLTSTRNLP